MFPLGSVLLPGEVLPLHVFEPRYRAMVQWCLDADAGPRFGVVLITRGHEVGGGDARHDVGVVARIVRHEQAPDGRFGLLCVGEERIRVTTWLPDDPFPLAMVEPMPEEAPAAAAFEAAMPAVVEAARELHRLLDELTARTGQEPPSTTTVLDLTAVELDDDERRAWWTYAVAAAVPLGPADRLRVLAAPGAVARLAVLGEAIEDASSAVRFRLA